MTTISWDRRTRLALALALVTVVSGVMVSCRSGEYATVPASGTVTYKGKPLEKGQVQLLPNKDGPVAVGSVENGKFILGTNQEGNGALPGKPARLELPLGAPRERRRAPERVSGSLGSALSSRRA